jgi:hypothetical protein
MPASRGGTGQTFALSAAAIQSHILDMEAEEGRAATLREVERIYQSYRGQVNALNKGDKT